MEAVEKKRVRVKAGRSAGTSAPRSASASAAAVALPAPAAAGGAAAGQTVAAAASAGGRASMRPSARYLRGDRAGVLHMRRAVTRDAKLDVLEAAERASALALDFMHNSGWIAGAARQIICDTVGEELKLSCRAKLEKLGYSEEEATAWRRQVEDDWREWSWNPSECDLAGSATIAEMVDAIIRSYMAYGEGFGVLDELPPAMRQRYGVTSGLKVSLVAPHRCPRRSSLFEGLEQGILKDDLGRARAYRFRELRDGIEVDKDVDAADVIHVMDRGENLNAPRGISPMAPAFKVIAQYDQLADSTGATALLQTAFAATLNSPEASAEAFEAILSLSETATPPANYNAEDWASLVGSVQADLMEVWEHRISALKEHGLSMNDAARINKLGPGETFSMHTAQTPGSQYLPYSQDLRREMARTFGLTFESFSMDHSNATYTSARMGNASTWPIVLRRRARIAVPFMQRIYERFLEERIREGRTPFKGGYQVFLRHREAVFQAEFQGPAAPVADDWKAANAAEKRLELGISTFGDECALAGRNGDEQIAQIGREIKAFEAAGVPHPFGRKQGGSGGPQGGAVEGDRTPANEDA